MINEEQNISVWSALKKISFRFIFIFFVVFIALFNNGAYPFWSVIFELFQLPLQNFVIWFGENILHLSNKITIIEFNGSGDTTYDYTLLLIVFIFSIFGTIVWSLLDRKRENYQKAYYWLTVAVRFYIGIMLIDYGIVKIIKLQFPSPSLFRLTEPFGEASPMGLAWTFLGFSKGYNLFMGIAEFSAILLLFRRTLTFGAVIILMTTANVMAVNYCYDVPVKIISTALFVMTFFLLSKNLKKIATFFFTGNTVKLELIQSPEIKNKYIRIGKYGVKYLIIALVVILGFADSLESAETYGDGAPKSKLYGLYTINDINYIGDSLNVNNSRTNQWKQFIIEYDEYAKVRFTNDSVVSYSMTVDSVLKKIDLMERFDTIIKCSFQYDKTSDNVLKLIGKIEDDSVSIAMDHTIKNASNYRLISRGFHWINETPYNK